MRYLLAAVLFFSSTMTALAQNATPVGTLVGTVTSNTVPVPGATVIIEGPKSVRTVSDAKGMFTVALDPGVYSIDVQKGGYVPAHLTDVPIFIGETLPVAIGLTPADLSSLRTIATVTTSRGSSINLGAASTSLITANAIANFPNPQINDLLEHVPDLTVQHMGSQPDTSIVLGGAQPYETQVLIDGHPLSMGQFGVWLSEYFSTFLLSNVETQTGPGNTTPFANTAVGGTANLVTAPFTQQLKYSFTSGVDNYAAQYSNFMISDTAGKLQYVAGIGYGSINGPYYMGNKCVVLPDNPANDNTPQSSGIVQFCGDSSGSLFTKGEILKFRYNFTPQTSLDFGFIGSQGGYIPQGTSYGQYLGVTKILPCLTSQPLFCNNPANSNLIGQSIDAYAWYPGSTVLSNQPIFTGQLRTSLGKATLLVRPYAGNIERIILGGNEQYFPYAFGPVGLAPSADPTNSPNAFENVCNNNNFLSQILTYSTPTVVNGQEECYQSAFSEYEQDKLYGTTFSLLQPVGDNLITLTYDFHGDQTFAYYNTPSEVATPNTVERYSTISLTGDLHVRPQLTVKAGLYGTTWKLDGSQPTPGATPDPATGALPLSPLNRNISRFDPHIGLVWQPKPMVAYRASFGTSETYPFSAQVSGLAFNTPPSATFPAGFVTQKNPFLNPETSSAFDFGADLRFRNGSVLSADLQDTRIRNVFETLTQPNFFPNGQALVQPVNAALLHAKLATIRYKYEPRVGLGYNGSLTAESSIVSGIPNNFYAAGPALPANGQQVCGFGNATPGSTTCLPYLKGYGQLTYSFKDATFAELGMEFQGKNNTYFQPPFAQWDFTVRRPVTKQVEVQVSAQNLFNTNNFYNLAQPNKGISQVAGTLDASGNYQLTSIPSVLIPTTPRTIRLQIRIHN